MNKEYSLNTTVSIVMPLELKVRLIEEAQRRTIEDRYNTTLSDVVRGSILQHLERRRSQSASEGVSK